MKYKRILCWVRPGEKKILKRELEDIKPIFVDD